eukprot:TRINITY_DN2316_c0_g1_i4.p1 TRINITY_DN2316_c0_g1~~TRINITY_DN2316_c0_g1_i4.p1  ORF type:complete len:1150 (+),score=238.13 TRINITY_DN2316_c0_g1_i4:315-3764(+)
MLNENSYLRLRSLPRKSTPGKSIMAAFKVWNKRPCIAYRNKRRKLQEDKQLNLHKHYNWFTYEQFYYGCLRLGRVFHARSYKTVGILSENRWEWLACDWSCMMQSILTVALNITFEANIIAHVMENYSLDCLVCSKKTLPQVMAAAALISAKDNTKTIDIVIMDDIDVEGVERDEFLQSIDAIINATPQSILKFSYFSELIASEPLDEQVITSEEAAIEKKKKNPKKIVTVLMTSGSTGLPKGVKINEAFWNKDICSLTSYPEVLVKVSYAPMAHAMDRLSCAFTLMNGGWTGIISDVGDLMMELAVIRPTVFSAPPAIFKQIYSDFKRKYKEAKGVMKENFTSGETILKDVMYESESLAKLMELKELSEETAKRAIKARLMNEIVLMFGGRIQQLSTGSANVPYKLLSFLRDTFNDASVAEGYGTTEVGGIAANGYFLPQVEFRLRDVPEMGYTSKDQPYPRGELCVRTSNAFSGYFNDDRATLDQFIQFDDDVDQEGKKRIWFKTGDIVEIESTKSRKFRILDRVSAIFKVSNGEFVCPQKIENTLNESPNIEQTFIHGDSEHASPIAVVVPSHQMIKQFQQSKSDLKPVLFSEIKEICMRNKFPSYEVPCNIYIEFEPFTPANGLQTHSFKLCRPMLREKYKKIKDELYQEIESQVQETSISNILFQLLGDPTTMSNDMKHIGDDIERLGIAAMGIGSLEIVQIIFELKSRFNIDISLQMLMGPSPIKNIKQLMQQKDCKKSSSSIVIWKKEIQLDDDIHPKYSDHSGVNQPIRTVLLTGSTGFLGAWLLVSLLQRGYKVICLVRSNTTGSALERIMSNLNRYQLFSRVQQFASNIVPLVGSLEQLRFGLSEDQFAKLASEIDAVYHCGAVVHALLPYTSLKESNVTGTKEVIRLVCQSDKPVVIHHISTMSVLVSSIPPDTPIQELEPDLSSLATGYAQSKLVAELILLEAANRGVRSVIYRPTTLSGDSTTGASNESDYVNRVLCGIVKIQKYCLANSIDCNIVPVDLASEAIVKISQFVQFDNDNLKVHNIVNPDDLPFQSVVEWIQQFGCKLDVVTYDVWKTALEQRITKGDLLYPLKQTFLENTKHRRDMPTILLKTVSTNPDSAFITLQDEELLRRVRVTQELFNCYLSYFVSKGWIPAP